MEWEGLHVQKDGNDSTKTPPKDDNFLYNHYFGYCFDDRD